MEHINNTLSQLAPQVTIEDERRVRDYLITHSHVIPTLPFAVSHAQNELGPDVQMVLQVDRSSGPGNEYLVLLLRLPQYHDGVSLDRFTQELTRQARDQMNRPEYHFIVMTDFVFAR